MNKTTILTYAKKGIAQTNTLLRTPTAKVALIAGIMGATTGLIKERVFSDNKISTQAISSPQKKNNSASNKVRDTEKFSPRVSQMINKYLQQNKLHIDAKDRLTITELWDVTHQLPQYWDFHEENDREVKKRIISPLRSIDISQTNNILKKHKVHTRITSIDDMNSILERRNMEKIIPGLSYLYRGKRPSTAPLGVLLHLTDNENPDNTSAIAGNTRHFGKNSDSIHFIITRQGDVLQTTPLNEIVYAAPMNVYDTKGAAVRCPTACRPDDTTRTMYDKHFDMFYINIELIADSKSVNVPIDKTLTKAQQESMFDLLYAFQQEYNFPTENITGHLEAGAVSIVKDFFPQWIKRKTVKDIKSICNSKPAPGYPSKLTSDFPSLSPKLRAHLPCTYGVGNAYHWGIPNDISPATWDPHADISHKEAEEIRTLYRKKKL